MKRKKKVLKEDKIKEEFKLIREYEKIIKLKYLNWTDQDYDEFEKWKEIAHIFRKGSVTPKGDFSRIYRRQLTPEEWIFLRTHLEKQIGQYKIDILHQADEISYIDVAKIDKEEK